MFIPSLLSYALRTKKEFNIGLAKQLWQAIYLRFGRTGLDPWEYYFFKVFLDRYSMPEKKRFAGWRREVRLDRQANQGDWRHLANDKLAFYRFMAARDTALPNLVAVFSDQQRDLAGTAQLRTADDARKFLSNANHYPLFVKPVRGQFGHDAFAISRISPDGTELELTSGRPLGLAAFIAGLENHREHGVLFQELLLTDEKIAAVCGDRLTSVRMIVIGTVTGPRILSAVWRIPTGTNMTDNFDIGRTGNLAAGVDLATGSITRVVQGAGWENIPVDRHPDTGEPLKDFRLPGWPDTQQLCLDLAASLPGLRLQHWDIALTRVGPVILEINVLGGMRTHQVVQQRGIWGERLERLYNEKENSDVPGSLLPDPSE